ncbi:putative 14-3-3 domain superfamily protein [Arabidopsis thaliana]
MMQLMNLTVSDESNKDMTLIIQLLRDNLNMWTLDLTEREEVIFYFPICLL